MFTCAGFGSRKILAGRQGQDCTDAVFYCFQTILSPFKPRIRKALAKLAGVESAFIPTGQGPVLDQNPQGIVDLYWELRRENKAKDRKKMVVAYSSADGHTKRMAEWIAQGEAGESGF